MLVVRAWISGQLDFASGNHQPAGQWLYGVSKYVRKSLICTEFGPGHEGGRPKLFDPLQGHDMCFCLFRPQGVE